MLNGHRAIDLVDLKIIRYLQDAPRASYATIAREIGTVSDATVKRRIDQLVADGIIVPAMIPDLYRLGFGSLALLGLTIDLPRLDEIADTLCGYPETTWVVGTLGKFDMIVFVACPSVEELMRFTGQQVASIPGVRSVDTLIAPRLFKQLRDWRVPIDTLLGLSGVTLPDGNQDSSDVRRAGSNAGMQDERTR
jgi:DNA-binding Lrp family transcriptional regulator